MKKTLLFIALFVVPIMVYLFFASGVNSFVKLPTLTKNIPEISSGWTTSANHNIQLKDKITVLGFSGDLTREAKVNIANLCHEIYTKNKKYADFQVVYVVPHGNEPEVAELIKTLSRDADLSSWFFVFADKQDIKEYYNKLQLKGTLDTNAGTPYAYLIDKELNLRGRKGKNKKGDEEYKEGYYTISPADLHNEMEDDVKVILAEYRFALKKNYKIESAAN